MARLFSALSLLFAMAIAAPAVAHEYKLGNLMIDHPWARASIGQAKVGAAYFAITNHGDEADRLIAVETPVAERPALHTHLMEDGVMKMRPVTALEIDPGAPTVLQPGGIHIMLMGLKAPLTEGETFPLVLTFEKSGSIEVEVKVDSATAMGPHGGAMHDHKQPGS